MAVKRSTKSKIFIIIPNALLLAVFIESSWCYKDQSQYAASGGEPLGIMFLYIVSFPALIVLGIILIGFKNRLQIPLFNGLIPFIGIVVLYLPLYADIVNRPTEVGLIGVGMGVALSIITMATTVAILVSKRNRA